MIAAEISRRAMLATLAAVPLVLRPSVASATDRRICVGDCRCLDCAPHLFPPVRDGVDGVASHYTDNVQIYPGSEVLLDGMHVSPTVWRVGADGWVEVYPMLAQHVECVHVIRGQRVTLGLNHACFQHSPKAHICHTCGDGICRRRLSGRVERRPSLTGSVLHPRPYLMGRSTRT